MESKLSTLHIDLPAGLQGKAFAPKGPVCESWEDEDDADTASLDHDDAPTPTERDGGRGLPSANPALRPPPPTPISPGNGEQYIDWSPARVLGGGRPKPYSPPTPSTPTDSDRERRRPEKTTATASRLIAAGLGMKAPPKSDDQRQYDRAVREQEMKRRAKEKEAQERQQQADDKVKEAMWTS